MNTSSGLICAAPEVNSLGLSLLASSENHLQAAFTEIEQSTEHDTTLIILETDLYRYCHQDKLEALFDQVKTIVVLDHLLTPTAEQADLVLPTTSFAEYQGSWVNFEGRLQSTISCFSPRDERRPAHQWLSKGTSFQSLIKDLSGFLPSLHDLPSLYQKRTDDFNIARQTIRSSGRTALHSYIDIKEIPPDTDQDSSYQYSQEGVASIATSEPSAIEFSPAYIWSPGWNSSEALSHFQDNVNGPIEGSSPGILLFQTDRSGDNEEKNYPTVKPENNRSEMPEGALHLLPYHHIFTDEELSQYSQSIHRAKPEPFVRMNPEQSQKMGFKEHDLLCFSFDPEAQLDSKNEPLTLLFDNSIPEATVLLPAYLIQSAFLENSSWVFLNQFDLSNDEENDHA